MDEIERIHAYLERKPGLHIVEPFRSSQPGNGISATGKFRIEVEGQPFEFKTEIPDNFPLFGIRFFYLGKTIARHLLRQGEVCVDSGFNPSFDTKLEMDFDAVAEWIRRFVLHPSTHQYEYLPIQFQPIYMLFDEAKDSGRVANIPRHGTFNFMALPMALDINQSTYLVLNLAGKASDWSSHYSQVTKESAKDFVKSLLMMKASTGQLSEAQVNAAADLIQGIPWPPSVPMVQFPTFVIEHINAIAAGNEGLFCILNSEPLTRNGELVRTLGELGNLLPQAFRQLINDRLARRKAEPPTLLNPRALFPFLPLLIGYPIPGGQELHWELILHPWEMPTGTGKERRERNNLIWGKTVNANYERFFGRGKLPDQITNGKVLILGLGAIGSSLAHTLVRGGARYLTVSDFDLVEAGNICRSLYSFAQVHRAKVESLVNQLMLVSPFVTLAIRNPFRPTFPDQGPEFEINKQELSTYDFIFDCTANDGLAWALDQMQLQTVVVNISITDEAKQLLAICNTGNEAILPAKRMFLASLGATEREARFFEGLGCWHPTFKASYADINLLLQHYVVDAAHRMEHGLSWKTTILETRRGADSIQVTRREDV